MSTNLEKVSVEDVPRRVVVLKHAGVERRHFLGGRAQLDDGPGVEELDPVGQRLVGRGKHRSLMLEELPLGAVVLAVFLPPTETERHGMRHKVRIHTAFDTSNSMTFHDQKSQIQDRET